MKRILMSLLASAFLAGCGNPGTSHAGVVSATHDCDAGRVVEINGERGDFTFTGTCDRIAVTGAGNTVTIERARSVAVTGAGNTLTVGAVDRISATGSDNLVTFRTGLSGPSAAAATTSGVNNIVEQAK